MGIDSFSNSPGLSFLLAPVQAVAAWFVPVQTTSLFAVPAQAPRGPKQLALPFAPPFAPAGSTGRRRSANSHSISTKTGRNASNLPVISHLKVVREFDSAVSPACAGRMVISGRMADVCAELERMIQHEGTHAGLFQP